MRATIRPYPLPDIQLANPEPARALISRPSASRLLSLDVFRGLVICFMLIVNNLGDGGTTGYFWKHADWPAMQPREAWIAWWGYASGSPQWEERAEGLPAERAQLEGRLTQKKVDLRLARENPSDPWQAERITFAKDQLEDQLRAIG